MHRLKRTETLERERKETEREGEAGDGSSTDYTYNTSESVANQTVMNQGVERMQQ